MMGYIEKTIGESLIKKLEENGWFVTIEYSSKDKKYSGVVYDPESITDRKEGIGFTIEEMINDMFKNEK